MSEESRPVMGERRRRREEERLRALAEQRSALAKEQSALAQQQSASTQERRASAERPVSRRELRERAQAAAAAQAVEQSVSQKITGPETARTAATPPGAGRLETTGPRASGGAGSPPAAGPAPGRRPLSRRELRAAATGESSPVSRPTLQVQPPAVTGAIRRVGPDGRLSGVEPVRRDAATDGRAGTAEPAGTAERDGAADRPATTRPRRAVPTPEQAAEALSPQTRSAAVRAQAARAQAEREEVARARAARAQAQAQAQAKAQAQVQARRTVTEVDLPHGGRPAPDAEATPGNRLDHRNGRAQHQYRPITGEPPGTPPPLSPPSSAPRRSGVSADATSTGPASGQSASTPQSGVRIPRAGETFASVGPVRGGTVPSPHAPRESILEEETSTQAEAPGETASGAKTPRATGTTTPGWGVLPSTAVRWTPTPLAEETPPTGIGRTAEPDAAASTAAATFPPTGATSSGALPAATDPTGSEDRGEESEETPRQHPYTWRHMAVLVAVAFVLGMLIMMVLNRPDGDAADDPEGSASSVVSETAASADLHPIPDPTGD